MVKPLTFPSNTFPEHLKWQTLSFLRMYYPEGFTGENRLRDWVTREEDHPIHIVLVANNILISHANVVWKYLDHDGATHKAYGLTNVFTYPPFRGQGYGSQIVAAGTKYIRKSDADVAMLYCDEGLRDLYANLGWRHMEMSTSYTGTKEEPELVNDEILMMLFLSPKGQQAKTAFKTRPIHFSPDYTW